jgi:hypothetical protein
MAQNMTIAMSDSAAEAMGWEPETPFLLDVPSVPGVATAAATSAAHAFAPMPQPESPFVSEYAGDQTEAGPQAEAFAGLLSELHDPEFEEALEDLVDEAAAIAEDRINFEVEDPVRARLEMERVVRAYMQPLERAADEMFDRMAADLADRDLTSVSETQLDRLLEQLAPSATGLSPTFENVLGGLFKKAKAAVSKVAATVGKVLPHAIIFNKLKGLVRPLLERVLRFAIDKLPVSLRPLAGQLAKRFLGVAPKSVAESGEEHEEEAAANAATIQEEFDTQLAGYLLQGEDFEREAAVRQWEVDQTAPTGDPVRELERSRAEFARRIIAVEDPEMAAPVVEQFVPAILAALKIGIKIIGRPRVVNFLAGLVAKLISKYVGQQQAIALSRALVDAGLRVVSLEVPERPEPVAAGYALASTVEDTINRLVQTAPEAMWESEPLLEAYTREAFLQAASAHFPDSLIREDLHEAAQVSGAWVALPVGSPQKRYKKYTRVIEVTITPQTAAAVKTFSGLTLASFLKDRLGLAGDKPIRARVHLYEAIPGTRLSLIALHEKNVAGLGTARREGWSLFHPLTPEASGLLINEPGLGRPVSPVFLARRGGAAVGQRFYYLEIPGARVRMAAPGPGKPVRPARSTQLRVLFDFPKRQLKLFLFYSEAHAQELAKRLRQRLPVPAILAALKAGHDVHLVRILAGEPTRSLRVIHETAPTEELAAPLVGSVLRVAGRPLANTLLKATLEVLKREIETRYDRFVGEFERVVKDDADGVTLMISFPAPPLLESLRRLFSRGGIAAAPGIVGALAGKAISEYTLEIRPGFVSW